MTIDVLSFQVIGPVMVVHTELGSRLNEKPYDACLGDQLFKLALPFERQVRFPVMRDGRSLQTTFRVDYVVKKAVIIEIKAVQSIHPSLCASALCVLCSPCVLGAVLTLP